MTFNFATFEGQGAALGFGLRGGHMTLAWILEEEGHPEIADLVATRHNYLAELFNEETKGKGSDMVPSRLWVELWAEAQRVNRKPKPRKGSREPAYTGGSRYKLFEMKENGKNRTVFDGA